MKAIVINNGSAVTKRIHKKEDYNLAVIGFSGTDRVKYSKELSGETSRLKDLADYSEKTEKTLISAFDTDNYGIIKHSAGVFDNGKLLGISDMTVSYSASPYMPGAHGKLYSSSAGKIAVAIGDDIFRFELFKSFAICGAETVIVIRNDDAQEIHTVLTRAYAYLLGFPILLVNKNNACSINVKGEINPPNGDIFELIPLYDFSLKTTKIKLNK